MATASKDKTVKVWDTKTGDELFTISGHQGAVGSVTFGPDGKTIVTASDDRTVKIWDAKTGAEIKTLSGHKDAVWDVVIYESKEDSKEKFIISGSRDGTVRIWKWKANTYDLLHTLKADKDGVQSVALTNDGSRLATTGKDRNIKIWDLDERPEPAYYHRGTYASCKGTRCRFQ